MSKTIIRSFATHPKSKHWSKNNTISPEEVSYATHKKYLFVCPICKHEFETSPNDVTGGHFCGYCTNKRLCDDDDCNYCYEKSFAVSDKAENWSDKNILSPRNVFRTAHKKYLFFCPDCKHEFLTSPNYIADGNFCAYCTNKRLCCNLDCDICFDKSFATHEMATNWSDKNIISATDVFITSGKKCIFLCPDCKHEFTSTLSIVSKSDGNFCPYCSSHKLCNDADCDRCVDKSFAYNEMALCWSEKNKLSALDVFLSSDRKFIFDCPNCKHEFDIRLANISHSDHFCPYCSSQKLCNDANCIFCFNKSFASHKKSEHWSGDNILTPRQVFKGSRKKYKFDCPDCERSFSMCPNHINYGSFCSHCVNKTEHLLLKFLEDNFDTKIKHQKKFDWCRNIKILRFDFFIEEYNLLIELDGPQHFKQVSNWLPYLQTQKSDIYKMKCANKHGYSMIRIAQADVWDNKNNWKKKLKSAINNSIDQDIMNIFIGNIYSKHPVYKNNY